METKILLISGIVLVFALQASADGCCSDGECQECISCPDTSDDYFPWAVSVREEDNHQCTGALLCEDVVLTKASCAFDVQVTGDLLDDLGVRYDTCLTGSGQLASVVSGVNNLPNDYALLTLSGFDSNNFPADKCPFVDLPQGPIAANEEFDVNGYDAGYLFKVRMEQVPIAQCNGLGPGTGTPPEPDFFCAQMVSSFSPCVHDLGSLAVRLYDGNGKGICSGKGNGKSNGKGNENANCDCNNERYDLIGLLFDTTAPPCNSAARFLFCHVNNVAGWISTNAACNNCL